jgi:hypothetical protein
MNPQKTQADLEWWKTVRRRPENVTECDWCTMLENNDIVNRKPQGDDTIARCKALVGANWGACWDESINTTFRKAYSIVQQKKLERFPMTQGPSVTARKCCRAVFRITSSTILRQSAHEPVIMQVLDMCPKCPYEFRATYSALPLSRCHMYGLATRSWKLQSQNWDNQQSMIPRMSNVKCSIDTSA